MHQQSIARALHDAHEEIYSNLEKRMCPSLAARSLVFEV